MYHSIGHQKSKSKWPWEVSIDLFIQQIDYLQDQGWETILPSQLHNQTNIDRLPKKSVMITFDDGYANNFLAFKELVSRKMVASWFIVTNDIGCTSSWPSANEPLFELLTAAQLIEMHHAGMEIGSHTCSHQPLTKCTTQQVKYELMHSRAYLSEILNTSVSSLAYPYGLYDSPVLSAAYAAGYHVAFTTSSGFGLVNQNPLEVRRVSIMAQDSLPIFARKLVFADNDVGFKKSARYVINRVRERFSF